MKTFSKIACFSLMIFGSGALAQVDPDPDGLGLYFDEGATEVSAMVAEGTESVAAYLVLTRPSIEGNLLHWSAGVSAQLGEPASASLVAAPTAGYNLVTNMPGSAHWVFEVTVGDSPPLPTADITVLAVIHVSPSVYDTPIPLFVTYGSESAGYGTDIGGAYFQPSSGSWDLPVATLNGQAPVEVESQSWGQLKSAFK